MFRFRNVSKKPGGTGNLTIAVKRGYHGNQISIFPCVYCAFNCCAGVHTLFEIGPNLFKWNKLQTLCKKIFSFYIFKKSTDGRVGIDRSEFQINGYDTFRYYIEDFTKPVSLDSEFGNRVREFFRKIVKRMREFSNFTFGGIICPFCEV